MSQQQMPILQHIQTLRKHILHALLWLLGFSMLAFAFMEPLINFLKRPYETFRLTAPQGAMLNNLSAINIFEVITINCKLCVMCGFIISLPLLIWEIWKFVAPGLYPSEKKLAKIILIASVFLFYGGTIFSFFAIIPYFFANALTWASHYAFIMVTYESYFNTLITLLLIFAIIFELPVILSLLGLAGVVPVAFLKRHRKIIFLVCIIVGAILAPPDVLSMCLVGLPMYLMVEISIYVLSKLERRRQTSTNILE